MRLSRTFAALVLAIFVVALPACGSEDVEEVATEITDTQSAVDTAEALLEEALTLDLDEQNGSGISGTATITPTGTDSFDVLIELTGAGAGPQPAHIHPGTCANLDPTPKYPLSNVENGRSETSVQAPPLDLISEDLAINVHKSEAEADTYVACGDLPTAQ
jgi:hypothetical protein